MTDPQRPAGDPVLITDAAQSADAELAIRKRRYLITMGLRIPFMLAAAACYQIPWLAVALIVASIPLPWIAVLIANDRLPKKSEAVARYNRNHPQLEATPHRVIDGS